MKPAELASALRRIASGIENSKQPSRNLVARDLKSLIQKIATDGLKVEAFHDSHDGALVIHMERNGKKTNVKLKDSALSKVLEECGESKLSDKCAKVVVGKIRSHIDFMSGSQQAAFQGLEDAEIHDKVMAAWGSGLQEEK